MPAKKTSAKKVASKKPSGGKQRKALSLAARKEQAAHVNAVLKATYPDAHCWLVHQNALQLLVATILSAQCTDARVNQVTPGLFARYPDAEAFRKAPREDIEDAIKSTGFYRNKAQSIQEACGDVVDLHGGQVPSDLEALTALRGVGRKTANVVRGNAFGIPAMVVDTHVGRIAQRLALTDQHDPVKVEFALMEILPKEDWVAFSHRMIQFGRTYCKAPKPICDGCPMLEFCPYSAKRFLKEIE